MVRVAGQSPTVLAEAKQGGTTPTHFGLVILFTCPMEIVPSTNSPLMFLGRFWRRLWSLNILRQGPLPIEIQTSPTNLMGSIWECAKIGETLSVGIPLRKVKVVSKKKEMAHWYSVFCCFLGLHLERHHLRFPHKKAPTQFPSYLSGSSSRIQRNQPPESKMDRRVACCGNRLGSVLADLR